jgi:hypothetical protein
MQTLAVDFTCRNAYLDHTQAQGSLPPLLPLNSGWGNYPSIAARPPRLTDEALSTHIHQLFQFVD